jgi:hypothetical protein
VNKVIVTGKVRVYLGGSISHDYKDSLIDKGLRLAAEQIVSGGKVYSKEFIVINYQVETEIEENGQKKETI